MQLVAGYRVGAAVADGAICNILDPAPVAGTAHRNAIGTGSHRVGTQCNGIGMRCVRLFTQRNRQPCSVRHLGLVTYGDGAFSCCVRFGADRVAGVSAGMSPLAHGNRLTSASIRAIAQGQRAFTARLGHIAHRGGEDAAGVGASAQCRTLVSGGLGVITHRRGLGGTCNRRIAHGHCRAAGSFCLRARCKGIGAVGLGLGGLGQCRAIGQRTRRRCCICLCSIGSSLSGICHGLRTVSGGLRRVCGRHCRRHLGIGGMQLVAGYRVGAAVADGAICNVLNPALVAGTAHRNTIGTGGHRVGAQCNRIGVRGARLFTQRNRQPCSVRHLCLVAHGDGAFSGCVRFGADRMARISGGLGTLPHGNGLTAAGIRAIAQGQRALPARLGHIARGRGEHAAGVGAAAERGALVTAGLGVITHRCGLGGTRNRRIAHGRRRAAGGLCPHASCKGIGAAGPGLGGLGQCRAVGERTRCLCCKRVSIIGGPLCSISGTSYTVGDCLCLVGSPGCRGHLRVGGVQLIACHRFRASRTNAAVRNIDDGALLGGVANRNLVAAGCARVGAKCNRFRMLGLGAATDSDRIEMRRQGSIADCNATDICSNRTEADCNTVRPVRLDTVTDANLIGPGD